MSMGAVWGVTFETPIITPTIPPSPDYTPASPDYSPASDSESNPSEDPSLDHIPPLPATSPFLSSINDTTDSDSPDTPPSPTHDYGEKRVGPLPTHCLAVRHSADHSSLDSSSDASSDFHSDASSDSSSRHSLSGHSSPDLPSTFTGPSRKRRRSPMTSVPALPLTILRGDINCPVNEERSIEQDIDLEIQAEIDECFAYADALRDKGIDARVDILEPAQEGAVEVTYETLGDLVQRKMPNTQSGVYMTHEEVEELVTRRVAEEMEAREAVMNLEPLNENGDEQEDGNGGNRGNGNGGNKENRNRGNGGNRNGENEENGNGNRNRNHGMNNGGTKCVVGLTRLFEKMETVFNISNCPSKYQVKYATCTLHDSALTWWNSHKRTIGVDASYANYWAGLMRLMTEVYWLRNEIQKIETELWNLTMK
ncbi:hypothetical protein Tco_0397309 [Tanacetum coccineum]